MWITKQNISWGSSIFAKVESFGSFEVFFMFTAPNLVINHLFLSSVMIVFEVVFIYNVSVTCITTPQDAHKKL